MSPASNSTVLNSGERALLDYVCDCFAGPANPNIVTFSTSRAHTRALNKLGFVPAGPGEYVKVPAMATVLRAELSQVKAKLGKLPPTPIDTIGHMTLIDPVCPPPILIFY